MKISKYISKYDYIGYYTKQKSMWFFTNTEIEAGLNVEKDKLMKLNNSFSLDDETEDDEENYDPLSFMKTVYFEEEMDINLYDDEDKSDLDAFTKTLDRLRNVDDLNPLIVQGRILDEKSKAFIVSEFNISNDFVIFDFDQHKIKLEEADKETKNLILNNKKIIIFQPVFLDINRKIITKCDALIKDGIDIKIIETKGTTNLKKIHFLDLYYQKRLLDEVKYLNSIFCISYFLCCVKYERLNRNQVSFIISDHLNFSKNGFSKNPKKEYTDYELMQYKVGIKEKNSISIESLLTQSSDLSQKVLDELIELEKEFDTVIENLWIHKNSMNPNSIPKNFLPSKEDKGKFKDTDNWQALKNIYTLKNFIPFKFSGNVTNHSLLCFYEYRSINDPIMNFKSFFKTMYEDFLDFAINQKSGLQFKILNKDNLEIALNKLKKKKVYFDFETINSAIRPINNIFPFTQVVTQCSVLKDHGNGIENEECSNLMVDPKDINPIWWKEVIDGLYEGNDYSYVVYNAAFETTRLKEIKTYISDSEYHTKIDCIINNIYDLADFFDLRKKIFIVNELFGLYSIKKVLPLIEKYTPNLFKKTKCLDYKELEIGNGLVCQNKSTCRFLNQINDKEWENIVNMSKIYCENDVRAMVAVEKFITSYLLSFDQKKE